MASSFFCRGGFTPPGPPRRSERQNLASVFIVDHKGGRFIQGKRAAQQLLAVTRRQPVETGALLGYQVGLRTSTQT